VPEDLHLANKKVLVHRALKLGTQNNSPYKLANTEIPFVMGVTRNKPGVSHLLEADHA
jgi:flagellar biosynthesis protein FlhF